MSISTVKLSQLRLSPMNVRSGKPTAIDALAQDIAAHGVIQSLSVYEDGGRYHVFAGGRRFRALKQLAKAKTISGAYEVPVIVRTIEEAHELSLAENVSRQPMHVADCVVAYGKLRDELGLEPQSIAMRFGVSPDYVRRVLKLSALAPICLTALATDKIGIATAQALTLTDDHAEQVRLLEEHGDNEWQIKRALTRTKTAMNSGIFRFVGADVYTEAGGTITRDLFDTRDEGFADNPELLEGLATELLEQAAKAAAAHGWQNVTVSLERPNDYYNRPRSHPDTENGQYNDDAKQNDTLHLFISGNGEIEEVVFSSRTSSAPEKVKAPKADWSVSLVHDLSVTRTMALQQQIAQRPDIAFDLLLATLVDQLGFNQASYDSALSVDVKRFSLNEDEALTNNGDVIPVSLHDTPVLQAFDGTDSFQIVRQMDEPTKQLLLSYAVAQMFNGVNNAGYDQNRLRKVDAVAEAIEFDMSQHWKASPHLFARAGKATTLKVIAEQLGQGVADNVSKLKKMELATVAAERLDGLGWLPPALALVQQPDADRSNFGSDDDGHALDDGDVEDIADAA
jgi:ParB family transcriptional regulator, chromosome partitioning protein